MRRTIPLVLAALFLALPVPAAAPHLGGTTMDPVLVLWGCPPRSVGLCTYAAETTNRTLIFFRFDLNADGRPDYPDQSGAGPLGRWTTSTTVSVQHREPSRGACAEAWDGVSTRREGGQPVPANTPLGCTTFVEFLPQRWDRGSPDHRAWATLSVPPWLDPSDFNRWRAEVEGIRASPFPCAWLGGCFPYQWTFRFDRGSLMWRLPPGPQPLHFTIAWSGATFTAVGWITVA